MSATDASGERVLEADAIGLNLGLVDLVRGTLHVEHLTLDNPFLRVDLLEGNRISLAEDWRGQQPNADGNGQTSEPWPVVFDEATINGGRLRFRDFTRGLTPIPGKSSLSPWNLP